VYDLFNAAGLGARVSQSAGLVQPITPGSKEDKQDRTVYLFLAFSIKIEDLSFYDHNTY
jgi:hypothetical protein